MICVVGDYITDEDVWLATVRQSPEGWFPIVRQERIEQRDGGAGAVANMVEGLGELVQRIESHKPRCIKRRHYLDGRQIYRLDEDCLGPIGRSEAEEVISSIDPGDLVLVADYGKGVVTAYLWGLLRACGATLIVDPSRHRPLDWYEGATAILPNRSESGAKSVSHAIELTRDLRRSYPHVTIKLDRDGMVVDEVHVPATCLDPVDVCGAGDMVLASAGVGMARGQGWQEACRFANVMAGRKCLQQGASPIFHYVHPQGAT